MKSKQEILRKLSSIKSDLQKRYPIASLAVFGSYSRGDQKENSDVDVMVEFSGKIGTRFFLLAEELEQTLEQRVDLVSRKGIKDKYFRSIKDDLVYV